MAGDGMQGDKAAKKFRPFKERAQPQERKKWGLLEKHKDYSARARDFNAKKTKLRALRQKLLDKNPDEFYFGMMSRKGPATTGKNRTGTRDGSRGNKVLDQEAVRLFKTQDLGYIRTMRCKAMKDVEELEERAVGIKGEGKRVVFVQDEEEQIEKVEENDMGMDDEEEVDPDAKDLRKLQQKETHKLEAKLAIARERLKALTDAEEALDVQRAKMAKSPTVGGINKNGVRFKIRERKR
ncbi:hypothetical protein B7494_g902 [Chlorociboria aeruginascens]|nr:hypothetical protein B7494_g902 [Chlorociboria aeruginascens]